MFFVVFCHCSDAGVPVADTDAAHYAAPARDVAAELPIAAGVQSQSAASEHYASVQIPELPQFSQPVHAHEHIWASAEFDDAAHQSGVQQSRRESQARRSRQVRRIFRKERDGERGRKKEEGRDSWQ